MAKNSRFKTQSQRKSTSKGEEDVFRIFKKLFPIAVVYSEYPLHRIISDCYNNQLMVDLYCQTFNVVIEFDGEFHYKAISFGKSEKDIFEAKRAFEEQQKVDVYKNKLFADANIKLIRIPYFEWEKLKDDDEKASYILERL